MPSLNLCPGGHRRPTSKGVQLGGMRRVGCVVTPKGTGPLAPTAGERGCRCQEKEAGTWCQRYVWLVVVGGDRILLQVWVLVRLLFTSPLDPIDSGLTPQPPLSSTHGDPQAILSPSGEDCCSQTLLPIWDTSRESTRQTWPCPQTRECLEGKEASPIARGSQSP